MAQPKLDLIYWGAFRQDRVIYFDKYFVDTPYNVYISTSKKNEKSFDKYGFVVGLIQDINTGIQDYKATLYIEDKKLHDKMIYHSPANRFYEALGSGIAIFFDKNTEHTFRDYDIKDYIVKDKFELADKLTDYENIRIKQTLWRKDYVEELKNNFRKIWKLQT